MRVTLINYTGMGHPDPLFAARLLAYTKNTRLEQGEETRAKVMAMTEEDLNKELDYISKTLRSSWEFVDYTFEVQGVTRAFTHQFVRTRTGSYAQQAQRVVDMGHFETLVPETVKSVDGAKFVWDELMGQIQDSYQKLQDFNVPNQDCRGVLPTNVLTNIIAKFNLRTMADLLAKRKGLRAQGEYADVARAMEAAILEVHPWAEPFINPERLQTPALDAILKRLLGDRSPVELPEINAALKEIDGLKGTWG